MTEKSFFQRLKQGLTRTRENLLGGLGNLFLGKKEIDEELSEALETTLIQADVGVNTTQKILASLTDRSQRKELDQANRLQTHLETILTSLLTPVALPLTIKADHKPFVILVAGINGAGKTTTIGKLAYYFKQQGKSVLLAAGDTFRAAAVEQLKSWGERYAIPIVAQATGADPAAVIHDAFQSAQSRKIDILIADTAGRLHTQQGLMAELKKMDRVIKKQDPTAPHETLLVLDGSIGQNALSQVAEFSQAIFLTGLVITKLDGTAKGGILFALAEKHPQLPIRFIGVGEQVEDLQPFDASNFVKAIIHQD